MESRFINNDMNSSIQKCRVNNTKFYSNLNSISRVKKKEISGHFQARTSFIMAKERGGAIFFYVEVVFFEQVLF